MSEKELRRVEALTRVKGGGLKLLDAAVLLEVSYRQVKPLRKRYREGGGGGLLHSSVGRESNRSKPQELREKVLRLVRKQHSGGLGEG